MKREMSYQTVDLSGVCDRNSLHDRLQESLTPPSWYGRNLDALYDALTDAPGPIHICFTAWKGMEEADPAYFKMFRSVLQAIRAELPGSSFLFSEEDSADGSACESAEEAEEAEPGKEAEEAVSEKEGAVKEEEERESSAPGCGGGEDDSFFRT
jgi:RNAse (barnase) inhibitor barstar